MGEGPTLGKQFGFFVWYHVWGDRLLSGVNAITLVVSKTLPCLSSMWSTSSLGSDWHGGKNAVALFSINEIDLLYIFFKFSIGPAVC